MNCTLEQQLFDWEDWEESDTGVFSFTDIIMKINFHTYKAGQRFSHAVIDMQQSRITFYSTLNDEIGETFELLVSIGDALVAR